VAVAISTRPITRGAKLVSGSLPLILMRALLLVMTGLPMLAVSWSTLAGGAARRPYFTDVQGRLPAIHFLRFIDEMPSLGGPIAAALLIGLLGEQVLLAGALAWLDPKSARRGPTFGPTLRVGFSWLGPMLRVTACAAVLSSLGVWGIDKLIDRIVLHGDVAGWSGRTLVLVMPLVQAIATLLWVSLVGAWAFWCRVVLVAGDRRRVRTTALLALKVFARAPARGPLFFMLVTIGCFLGSAAVLIVWRQLPPRTIEGVAFLAVVWLVALLAQAWLWHWLLRAARLLYADARFAEIRAHLDPSKSLWSRLRLRFARPTTS
jgi:hypothetical protein